MPGQFEAAFNSRTDLEQYRQNALTLFALEMRFRLEDVHTVAATALTDSPDDKKCDLVYVDEESGDIVVAQGYMSLDSTRPAAKSNKASDLNTAAAWLFGRDQADLPESLRPAAGEISAALQANTIRLVQFWFVHNLPESHNVRDELRTVESTVRNSIAGAFAGIDPPEISAIEVGRETLDQWYQSLQNPILVNDSFEVDVPGGYPIAGADWEAYATTIPARWLYEIFKEYKSKLFSANIRGYLGSRRSSSNINHGIKSSAQDEPGHFWVFNNGLTALVHDFKVTDPHPSPDGSVSSKIAFTGLSIVNGAQTTGAIGSLGEAPSDSAFVQARFVKCTNYTTLKNIIRNNNSQNRIEVTDFRSRDPVQERLRTAFGAIPGCQYTGGRRGGHEDVIRRPPDLLPAETCTQALAAFHSDPEVAYHQKTEIWNSNKLYDRYFSEKTTAEHILFCYSLLRTIETKKLALTRRRNNGGGLTSQETAQLDFLNQRGSLLLFASAIARSIESFLNRAVPNPWRLSFGVATSPPDAQEYWSPIVDSTISFCTHLFPATKNGLKSREEIQKATSTFSDLIEAVKTANHGVFETFATRVHVAT